MMQVFEIKRSIETKQLFGEKIGDHLQSDTVRILTDDNSRIIFLFRGKKASMVDYLVGKRLAKEIRIQMRGFYAIKEISEDDDAFQSMREQPCLDQGNVKEMINSDLYSQENPYPPNSVPIATEGNWRSGLTMEKLNLFDKPKVSEILPIVKALDEIEGYKSELTIIGTSIHVKVTQPKQFLANNEIKKETESKFMKIGNLSDGFFFDPEYTCHFEIKNGHFQYINLLKAKLNKPHDQGKYKGAVGQIRAPLLFIPRIMHDHSIQIIQNNFKIPDTEPIDDVIARAKNYVPED